EIDGPGAGLLRLAASGAMVLAGVLVVALAVRVIRRGSLTLAGSASVMTATIALIIASNKVFSPQYVLWLLAPVALLTAGTPLGALRGLPAGGRRRFRGLAAYATSPLGLAAQAAVIAALTHVIYPLSYRSITGHPWDPEGQLGIVILAVRNLLFVVFTLAAVVTAWRATRVERTNAGPASIRECAEAHVAAGPSVPREP
ncbi:MAG: hypothetical protein Q4G64_10225, partial [bacterium]|nr:hypothetical protein [bacterium]